MALRLHLYENEYVICNYLAMYMCSYYSVGQYYNIIYREFTISNIMIMNIEQIVQYRNIIIMILSLSKNQACYTKALKFFNVSGNISYSLASYLFTVISYCYCQWIS